MLAGDAAAHFDAHFQNAPGEGLASFMFAGHAGIKKNQRMQVAIARMKNIRAAQPVLLRQRGNPPQGFAESAARNDPVLHNKVGTQSPHCREGAFATLPNQRAVVRIPSHPTFQRSALLNDRGQTLFFALHLFDWPFEFHDEHGGGIGWIPAMSGGLGRINGEAVHDLDGPRQDACRDDGGNSFPSLVGGVVTRQQRMKHLRFGDEP